MISNRSRNLVVYQLIRPEEFGNAPCLSKAALWFVRLITVEYLRNGPETAVFSEVLQQRLDKFSSLFFAFAAEAVDLQETLHKLP